MKSENINPEKSKLVMGLENINPEKSEVVKQNKRPFRKTWLATGMILGVGMLFSAKYMINQLSKYEDASELVTYLVRPVGAFKSHTLIITQRDETIKVERDMFPLLIRPKTTKYIDGGKEGELDGLIDKIIVKKGMFSEEYFRHIHYGIEKELFDKGDRLLQQEKEKQADKLLGFPR